MRSSKSSADGPRPSEELVPIGKVVGVFGLRGWLKVAPLSAFEERFAPGSTLTLRGRARQVTAVHWHEGQARIHLEGIDTPEEAEAQRGEILYGRAEDRPRLGKNEYLVSDLVGLRVLEDGQEIGTVDDVLSLPAQDVLRVGETLIPLVRQFVRRIAIREGVIEVRLIPGMRPGERAEESR